MERTASFNFPGPLGGIGTLFQGNNKITYNTDTGEIKELDDCIDALNQENPEDIRSDILTWAEEEVDEGTCQWILDDTEFQKWCGEDSQHPLIWVCDREGERGQGKSLLAAFISKHLEAIYEKGDDCWVLYYFCGNVLNRDTAHSILKGFMYSLHRKQKSLTRTLRDEYRLQRNTLLHPRQIEPLWRIFQAMVKDSQKKRIYCVIDGIDRCSKGPKELEHFLKKVNVYFTKQSGRRSADLLDKTQSSTHFPSDSESAPDPKLHMIILSRERPDCIEKELGSFPRITMQRSGVSRHIKNSADKISASCTDSKVPSQETIEMVTKVLSEDTERSFLWVSLAAERLMGLKQNQIKERAAHMPTTVEALHIQTLRTIPPRQQQSVAALLRCVTMAVRPLSTLELTKAVKYAMKTSFTKRALKKALSLCGGLVRRQGKKVILTHLSVQDFLCGEHSPLWKDKEIACFAFDRSNAQSELANICIAYLQGSANLDKSRRVRLKPGDKLSREDDAYLRKHPFLEYAIIHWTTHARDGNLEKTNYDSPFFKDKSTRRKLWWESYWISTRQRFAWKWTTPGKFSLLHLAAFFGIVPLAEYVEKQQRLYSLMSAEDHQGMKPINRATENSQVTMVKFLLQRGEYDEEALRQAAQMGDAAIIKMLLDNKKRRLSSPKLISARSSPAPSPSPFQSIRKATLSSMSDLSKKRDQGPEEQQVSISPEIDGYGKATSQAPLHIAASCGHEEALSALIDGGEDYQQTTDGGWTPLHNAAWYGRVSIVGLLTNAGAETQAVTKEGLTLLHCAVKNSQVSMTKYLLSKQVVDIEARDSKFGLTSFHMACKNNHLFIMEVLLDYGANIETKMVQGWTPLIWACMYAPLPAIELLLKRGADTTAKLVQRRTEAGNMMELGPIGVAKAYNRDDVAHLVERFGAADLNRAAADEVAVLPPLQSAEEIYDLPQVPQVINTQPEETEGVSALDAEILASADDSDDESDDDSIISETEETRSRKQSESDISRGFETRRQSSFRGLGIDEVALGSTGYGVVHDGIMAASREGLQSGDRGQGQVSADLELQDKTQSEVEVESEDPAKEDVMEKVEEECLSGPANDTVPVDTLNQEMLNITSQRLFTDGSGTDALAKSHSQSAFADQRSSSLPTLPGSLGERIRRFVPKRAATRTGDIVGEEREALSPTAKATTNIKEVIEDDGETTTRVVDSEVGSRGLFGTKRLLSWKSEGSGGIKGQVQTPEQDSQSSEIAGVDAAQPVNVQKVPDDDSCALTIANQEGYIASDNGARPGRFAPKAMFGWKTMSGKKDDVPIESSLVAMEAVTEDSEQHHMPTLSPSESTLSAIDDKQPASETLESSVMDQASKGGWGFPSKKSFGLKRAPKQ